MRLIVYTQHRLRSSSLVIHCILETALSYVLLFQMSVQEFPANSTIMDLLERAGRGSSGWTPDGFPKKEELMPRVNNVPVSDPTCKLKMGDKVELSPTIPDRALTDYREEIQRMYDRDLSVSSASMRPACD